jgi:hypothetical protein
MAGRKLNHGALRKARIQCGEIQASVDSAISRSHEVDKRLAGSPSISRLRPMIPLGLLITCHPIAFGYRPHVSGVRMFRISFLLFVAISLFGGLFRMSVQDLLLREAVHSFLPSTQRHRQPLNAARHGTGEQVPSVACDGDQGCTGGSRSRRYRDGHSPRVDAFGDNGPLDRRYPDPI